MLPLSIDRGCMCRILHMNLTKHLLLEISLYYSHALTLLSVAVNFLRLEKIQIGEYPRKKKITINVPTIHEDELIRYNDGINNGRDVYGLTGIGVIMTERTSNPRVRKVSHHHMCIYIIRVLH